MSHFLDVERLLGRDTLARILNYVISGNLSDQKIKDFAQRLGSDPESNILFGNHTTRVGRDRERGKGEEVREVLSDWWNQELHAMTKEDAIGRLVEVFTKIGAHPLAKHLKEKVAGSTTSNAGA